MPFAFTQLRARGTDYAPPPAYLDGLADLTPLVLTTGGTVWDATPAEWQGTSGAKSTQAVVGAWSGGAAEQATGKVYFSGCGHSDGANNGVYVCDFVGGGGVSLLPGSLSAYADLLANAPDDTYLDGRPNARHTYECPGFDDVRQVYVLGGSSGYGGGSGGSTVWTFDIATSTWTKRSGYAQGPSSVMLRAPDKSQWLSVGSINAPRFFDAATWAETISGIAPWGGQIDHNTVAAYDSLRDQYLFIGRNGTAPFQLLAYRIDVNWGAKTFVKTEDVSSSFTGADVALVAGGGALFYDAARDSFWMFGTRNDMASGSFQHIMELDAATLATTKHTLASPVTCGTYNRGTFGRFFWAPQWRMFGTVIDYVQKPIVMKLPV